MQKTGSRRLEGMLRRRVCVDDEDAEPGRYRGSQLLLQHHTLPFQHHALRYPTPHSLRCIPYFT